MGRTPGIEWATLPMPRVTCDGEGMANKGRQRAGSSRENEMTATTTRTLAITTPQVARMPRPSIARAARRLGLMALIATTLATGAAVSRPGTAQATYNNYVECRYSQMVIPAPRILASYSAWWVKATAYYRIIDAKLGTVSAWTKAVDYPKTRAVPYSATSWYVGDLWKTMPNRGHAYTVQVFYAAFVSYDSAGSTWTRMADQAPSNYLTYFNNFTGTMFDRSGCVLFHS